jgi:ZIP family zinc transporter
VLEAALWGLVGASSLLIGAAIGIRAKISEPAIGLILAFGAGTLISAVAFELTEEAYRTGGADVVALGLAAGALAYFAGAVATSRRGAGGRMSPSGRTDADAPGALLLGAVLDGIPESVVIGVGLLGGGGVSAAMLAAVFLSNLPESIAATTGLAAAGWAHRRIMGLWLLVTAVAGLAALAGYALLEGASPRTIAFVLAFAGGAIITMLADTMMPEAYRHGGRLVGVFTTLGFALAFWIGSLE